MFIKTASNQPLILSILCKNRFDSYALVRARTSRTEVSKNFSSQKLSSQELALKSPPKKAFMLAEGRTSHFSSLLESILLKSS